MTNQAPTPFETLQGYAPPSATQFSIFLDNRVGRLYDLVEAFDDGPCRICALDVHEASDFAVVRIVTNDTKASRPILRDLRLAFCENQLLIVEFSEGHTLSSMCVSLLRAELNVRFAYPLMLRPNGMPTMALATDDHTLAGQILRRKEFRLLGESELLD
jgi:hypothetical protein